MKRMKDDFVEISKNLTRYKDDTKMILLIISKDIANNERC